MITSIVPLSNWHQAGSPTASIQGRIKFMVGEDGSRDFQFCIEMSEGRNITITKPLYKYKMFVSTFVPGLMGATDIKHILHAPSNFTSESQIVFFSTEKIDTVSLRAETPNCVIFPVMLLAPQRTLLMTNSINRMFAYLTSGETVMTTLDFIQAVVQYTSYGAVFSEASWRGTSRLERNECLVEYFDQFSYSADAFSTNQTLTKYQKDYDIYTFQIDEEVRFLCNAAYWNSIVPYVNVATNNLHPLKAAVLRSDPTFIPPNIMTQSIDTVREWSEYLHGYVGTMLTLIYGLPESDWSIPVDTDEKNIGDIYWHGYTLSNGFVKSDLSRLITGRDVAYAIWTALQLPLNRKFIARKTFTEDLFILNEAGEIERYVDLVWWSMAAAPGLINSANACAFE